MKTHIPDETRRGKTYCGRLMDEVRYINLQKDLVDSATCKRCQATDDKRSVENYRKEMIAAGRGDEL